MHQEKLTGIIERITYHNEQNGWSVLKVSPFGGSDRMVTVVVHQAKVYAGATIEFWGSWTRHPKHGEQFKASQAIEKKPASAAALEKYLGSGLIEGVGAFTARKIVGYFKDRTLDVFENSIHELTNVPGIADKRLRQIKSSWDEHRSIRDVMIFLQGHGISTLFATKIYKTYGDQAIAKVSENPYRLAQDIYGIGFFSADKIALSMGFPRKGQARIEAGIKQVLSASRDGGHCFLTESQIIGNTLELLNEEIEDGVFMEMLEHLLSTNQVRVRRLPFPLLPTDSKKTSHESLEKEKGKEEALKEKFEDCFYAKSLYYDEEGVANMVKKSLGKKKYVDKARIHRWVSRYCETKKIQLSDEQYEAVCHIPSEPFSVLTGGPGCGKTTCTEVLVKLLKAMELNVTLTAPTGRAAQRMTEVIGLQAKTIHRLLEWLPHTGSFQFNSENPLETDFLILDEVSMLDISLAANLLKALPEHAQVLLIGDPDQLPAVGAGNVLSDLLESQRVPRFRLTKVFRQAQSSSIIRFAHEINSGKIPKITSPVEKPKAFGEEGIDCLFVDADEATVDQVRFIRKVHYHLSNLEEGKDGSLIRFKEKWVGTLKKTKEDFELDKNDKPTKEELEDLRKPVIFIPEKFKNVNLLKLSKAPSEVDQLMTVLKSVHPWSSLRYGLTALETTTRLYTKTIPEWMGKSPEIQLLSPQIRGSMGTMNLNKTLQEAKNPPAPHKKQLILGERIFREGDRVIQTRNNYHLGIFNGDIGKIKEINPKEISCEVIFSGNEEKRVLFSQGDLNELQLAYGITIHKSQGSEFEVVIIPVLGQHYNMLFRNLIYTGLTRAKKLAVFVGNRKALGMAIRQIDNRKRQTALTNLVDS